MTIVDEMKSYLEKISSDQKEHSENNWTVCVVPINTIPKNYYVCVFRPGEKKGIAVYDKNLMPPCSNIPEVLGTQKFYLTEHQMSPILSILETNQKNRNNSKIKFPMNLSTVLGIDEDNRIPEDFEINL